MTLANSIKTLERILWAFVFFVFWYFTHDLLFGDYSVAVETTTNPLSYLGMAMLVLAFIFAYYFVAIKKFATKFADQKPADTADNMETVMVNTGYDEEPNNLPLYTEEDEKDF